MNKIERKVLKGILVQIGGEGIVEELHSLACELAAEAVTLDEQERWQAEADSLAIDGVWCGEDGRQLPGPA